MIIIMACMLCITHLTVSAVARTITSHTTSHTHSAQKNKIKINKTNKKKKRKKEREKKTQLACEKSFGQWCAEADAGWENWPRGAKMANTQGGPSQISSRPAVLCRRRTQRKGKNKKKKNKRKKTE